MMDDVCRAVLLCGLDDWVPYAAVEWEVRQVRGGQPESETVEAAVAVIGTLVDQGLMEIGGISSEAKGFVKWEIPLEESLERIRHARQHSDRGYWVMCCWLRNTSEGDRVGEAIDSARRSED
jgi:hypothetical protein